MNLDAKHHCQRAQLYVRMRDQRAALGAFIQAHQADPEDLSILKQIGILHLQFGDYKEAKEAFDCILHRKPDDIDTIRNMIMFYRLTGQRKQALKFLNRVIDAYDRDEARLIRAEINIQTYRGKNKRGEKDLQLLVRAYQDLEIVKRSGRNGLHRKEANELLRHLFKSGSTDDCQ